MSSCPSSASFTLAASSFMEKGWVVKAPDEMDKRFVSVHLTEKAKTLRPALLCERQKANDEVLNSLSLEEKVLLKHLLKDIKE